MKPPRKPRSRPTPGRSTASRPPRADAPSRPSPGEQARRVAASWGVAPEKPAKPEKPRGGNPRKTAAPARPDRGEAPKRGDRDATRRTGQTRPTDDRRPTRSPFGNRDGDRDSKAGDARGGRGRPSAGHPYRTGGTNEASGARTRPPAGRPRTDDARPTRDRSATPPRGKAPAPAAPAAAERGPRARPDRTRGAAPRSAAKGPTRPEERTPGAARTTPARPASVPHAKAANEPQRIAKLLARAGVASRREIERMIAEGRVALDGVVLDTPATLLTSLRGVTVDERPVAEAEGPRLFLFHKPSGCLTTERDPAGRPTIYDRLPEGLPRLMPVGRLDMSTEGLLLLTNDGELKRHLELPANGVERSYRARAFGTISQAALEELIHGVEVEGVRYGRIDANLERRTGHNQWIEMTLTEGKNREVRRVLEYLGLKVNRLIRTRYGPFTLGGSEPGALAEIRRDELDGFLRSLKGER